MRMVALTSLLALAAGCGEQGPKEGQVAPFGLQVLSGTCTVRREGRAITVAPGIPFAVGRGDVVTTDPASEAVISAGEQVHLLHENSSLRFDSLLAGGAGGGAGEVSLLSGIANFFIPVKTPPQKFQAVTSTVVAMVRGTVFAIEATDKVVRVSTFRGQVDIFTAPWTSGSKPIGSVGPDHRVVVAAGVVTDDPASEVELAKIKQDLLFKTGRLHVDLAHF